MFGQTFGHFGMQPDSNQTHERHVYFRCTCCGLLVSKTIGNKGEKPDLLT